MLIGMPPSDHHRFYLRDADTVVELWWLVPAPQPGTGRLFRLAARILRGPDPMASPWHAVDHRAFEKAVDALATNPEGAVASFTRLGYDVVTVAGLRAAR